ncbi:cytochrome P450 20A1-like [Ptychodera flava]|uniref:cytochrome P450 20A1-like n=1 Tax=Ptychodera flava TaxID=63121 RepID=UPI00396A7204
MASFGILVAFAVIVMSILFKWFESNCPQGSACAKADQILETLTIVPGMKRRHQEDGNLQDITEAGGFPQFLFTLHEKYGPIASFWYGRHYYVSLGSPEAWKHTIKLFDRPNILYEFGRPMIGDDNMQYCNGEEGKARRKMYDVPFRHEAVKRYYEYYKKIADDIAGKLSAIPPGDHISLKEYMSLYVSRAFLRVSFGDLFDDERNVVVLHSHYETAMEALNQKIRYPCLETEENFKAALKVWHNQILDVILHRRENPPLNEKDRIFLDILLDCCKSEEHLLGEVAVYYTGGYHTTTFLLVWAFYYISRDMEMQDKIYEEITTILGTGKEVDFGILADLEYLKRVLNEAIRCSVLAPFAARVNNEEDMKVSEYTIEKGTGIVHAIGVVHMDKNIWPEPERFDPDRFLPEQTAKRHKLAFSPFGFAGKRMCPGYRLAYAEGVVLLATLCRKFKFHLVRNKSIQRKYGFVTLPSEEVFVTIEKREQR